MVKKIKTVNIIVGLFITFALLQSGSLSLAQTGQMTNATFTAQIINNSQSEADIQILSVSDNNFQLSKQDFINVNFASSSPAQTLQAEDIITGQIFYFQADVNNQSVDWYLVKDYQLSKRPLIKSHSRKIITISASLLSVLVLLAAEKIIQDSRPKLP